MSKEPILAAPLPNFLQVSRDCRHSLRRTQSSVILLERISSHPILPLRITSHSLPLQPARMHSALINCLLKEVTGAFCETQMRNSLGKWDTGTRHNVGGKKRQMQRECVKKKRLRLRSCAFSQAAKLPRPAFHHPM